MSELDQIVQKKDEEAQHDVDAKIESELIIWVFFTCSIIR